MNAELLLNEERESLKFALQSGRMGTWDIDLESGKVNCSKELLDLWGLGETEFLNDRSLLQSKVHPEDLGKMLQAIDEAITQRNIYELEYRIIPTPEKVCWVLSRGRCTFAPGSNKPLRLAGVVYDVTQRKEAELEIAKAVKARSDFFAIASHELKTPLTCMQLQINVLQWQLKELSEGSLTSETLSYGLLKQQEHLQRISRIVNNILDESRISEGRLQLQREQFDLEDMVKGVLDQMKLTAETAEVALKLNSSQSILGQWDKFRLEQVLLNLLMNAMRFGNKNPVEVELTSDRNQALIRVRDSGIGIKTEDQARIFLQFERANPEKEINGMGLGLYISKNIVEAHGGQILLKSALNSGSEFTVLLPLTAQ